AAQPGGEELIRAALISNAQKGLAEADLAFQNKNYNEATQRNNLPATTNPQYRTPEQVAHPNNRLAEIRATQGHPGGDLGRQQITDISIIRQRAKAEFDNHVAQAERALSAGDTGGAREQTAGARLTANSSAQYFSDAENQEMQKKADDLFRRIDAETER